MGIVAGLKAGVRTGRLGLGLRQLATADTDAARERARTHLACLMSSYRGLPAKLGQWLGAKEQDSSFAVLFESIPTQSWDAIADQAYAACPELKTLLLDIETVGRGGSIGQTHRCTLSDQTQAVIKVQYPDIAAAGQHELSLLQHLPKRGPMQNFQMEMASHVNELGQQFAQECDYQQEAAHQQRYAAGLTPEDHVCTPALVPQGCSATTLLQIAEDGVTLKEVVAGWPSSARTLLAERLITHWCRQFFERRFIHCDPHPGNYRFRGTMDPDIVLYDYGSCTEVTKQTTSGFYKLIKAAQERSGANLLACFAAIGFHGNKLRHIHQQLPAVVDLLCKPFTIDHPHDITNWQLSAGMQRLLGDQRWWFRSAAPASLLLTMRSFAGLVRMVEQLSVRCHWRRCLEQALTPATHKQLTQYTLPPCTVSPVAMTDMASNLRMHITRAEQCIVDVHMPATVLEDLESAMGHELYQRVQANIKLAALIGEARQHGYRPMQLFSMQDGDRHITVSLVSKDSQ